MNLEFILIQAIGILAWLMLVLSYYRKDTNRILAFQIIGTGLYCLHYYLLGAYSGLFICAFEVLINYLYYKTDKDKYIFLFSVPIHIIGGIFSFQMILDVFPIVASITEGYTLTKEKKSVVIGAIISYTLWVIYDLYVMSYSGALTDGLVVLSNCSILFFEYDIFKTGKKAFKPRKRKIKH